MNVPSYSSLNSHTLHDAITAQEGPDGEQGYSSTHSLTSALEGVCGQHYAPATLPPGKGPSLGGPHGRSGRLREISLPPGFDPQTVQRIAIPTTFY